MPCSISRPSLITNSLVARFSVDSRCAIGKVVVALAKAALLVFGLIERFDYSDARHDVR